MFERSKAEEVYKQEWSEVNIRYQIDSVIGFMGELLAIIIWNKHVDATKLEFGPRTKQAEVVGIDLYATNPTWKNKYAVQVKTVPFILNFTVKENWLKYSVDKVDRLVLVDIIRLRILHVNFKSFVERFKVGDQISCHDVLREIKNSFFIDYDDDRINI